MPELHHAEKRKFKLLAGSHRDEAGNVYKKGDVVESTDDLCQKFKSKFEEVK